MILSLNNEIHFVHFYLSLLAGMILLSVIINTYNTILYQALA